MPEITTEPKERASEAKPIAESPIGDLRQAIDALRGACSKLQISVQDINSDLEVTNQRLASAVRRYAETSVFLENILSCIPCGVIAVDQRGRIALMNKVAESLTGYSAHDITGKHYSQTMGRGVPERLTPLYTLATGHPIDQEEKSVFTADGEEIPVSFSTSLIVDSDGSIAGAIEVLTDLRRMKLLEAELERMRKLAAMGEIAATIAHEIRNPLGGIKGFTNLLERDLEGNPEAIKLIRRISEGIGSLERIVRDLLEAGQDLSLRLEHIDLVDEVRRVVEMFEMAARGEGRKVTFEVVCSEVALWCKVDPARIRQALVNLLRNSLEAVGNEGTISVHIGTQSYRPSGRETKPDRSLRDYICLEITDTGPGIPDEIIGQIFTPFFTTKDGGMGLGLSAVQRAVTLHGGEVRYVRPETGGSKFIVLIPRR